MVGKKASWRWLVSVPASVGLHAAGLLLVVLLFAREAPPPAVVLSLSDVIIASGDAERGGAPGPARGRAVRRAFSPRPSVAPHRRPPPSPAAPVEAREEKSASVPEATPDAWRGPEVIDRGEAGHPRLAGVQENGGGDAAGGPLASRVSDAGLALDIPGPGQDGAGSEYSRYLARLRQMIQDALHYPAAARRRSLAGTVQMEIVISPAGAVGQVSVLQSSSHRILDEAAVEAVRSLPPLPFPADLPPRTLRVRLPVVFELR